MSKEKEMFHVKFFESKKELYSKMVQTTQIGDYLFLSGDPKKRVPLWHTVKTGLILKKPNEKNLKLMVDEHDSYKLENKQGTMEMVKFEEKTIKLGYQHGFRIDQERIFCKTKGFIMQYDLKIHPMSKGNPLELVSDNPSREFLNAIVPGDYVMVWSRADKNDPTFLHYPVQGWLWDKNIETGEVQFIHPPRMDIQTFKCNDPKNPMIGFGYYRKLVYQLSNLGAE
jgi:hypothetical protein